MKMLLQYQGGRAVPRLARGELAKFEAFDIDLGGRSPITGGVLRIDGKEEPLRFGDELHIAFVRFLDELAQAECPGCGEKLFSSTRAVLSHLSGDTECAMGRQCCGWIWLDHQGDPWLHDEQWGHKFLPPGGRYRPEPRKLREWAEMAKDGWGRQIRLL